MPDDPDIETSAKSTPPLPQSPPEAFAAKYAQLREVPADVLATRVVGSLILCEGDLNRYKQVLTEFVINTRSEYTAGPERDLVMEHLRADRDEAHREIAQLQEAWRATDAERLQYSAEVGTLRADLQIALHEVQALKKENADLLDSLERRTAELHNRTPAPIDKLLQEGAWVPIEALYQTQGWLREVLDMSNGVTVPADKVERIDYIDGRLAEREKADAAEIAEFTAFRTQFEALQKKHHELEHEVLWRRDSLQTAEAVYQQLVTLHLGALDVIEDLLGALPVADESRRQRATGLLAELRTRTKELQCPKP